jgi:D-aminoacyl-tRNA deacylase
MRALIQRVNHASVAIDGRTHASIGSGMLILLGIEPADGPEDIQWLAGKIARLRIFDDADGVMNLPLTEVNGQVLVISQFTLHASTKKGNRPSYIKAAPPDQAIPLYESFIRQMELETRQEVASGIFGAYMKISLENDGPVTILIDTKNKE